MKKKLAILLTALFSITILSGCDLNSKPVTLEKSMDIPEDGIISESIMRDLKDENKVITFKGKSGKNEYEWTVFGSDIEEPRDTNLKVEIIEDKKGSMTFKLCTEEKLGQQSVLSLHSAYLWEADKADLYKYDKNLTDALTQVTLTGEKATVISFPISNPGQYIVKAEDEKSEKDEKAINPSTSSATATRIDSKSDSQNDGKSNENAKSEKETSRAISDGTQSGQDQYLTDPVPEGEPLPVEPENQVVNESVTCYCTFSIECTTILNNLDSLDSSKLDSVPSDGILLYPTYVEFTAGESVFDVLQRVCMDYGIHLEASWTPMYNSAYIEGMGNLYEFDCGSGSGWMYRVNGWYPNYGCSRYVLSNGDTVEWRYTCDLGADIGGGF